MRVKSNKGGLTPAVFFVDRSLGQEKVVQAIKATGVRVERHDDHFSQNAPDTEWLAVVGQRGWVALSKDHRVRYRGTERAAVIESSVAYFIFRGLNMRGDEIGKILAAAIPKIQRMLSKNQRPFIATISRSGELKIIDYCRATESDTSDALTDE